MNRIGIVLLLSLAVSACDAGPPAPHVRTKEERYAERAKYAVPPAERPVLGKVGDACVTAENEVSLPATEKGCLAVLKDTIKHDKAAGAVDVRLARMRAVFHQPGPTEDGQTVGWILYATRTNCETQEVWNMGNVTYDPDGVEISRATPAGGPLPLPVGVTVANLIAAVCPT